MFPLSPEKHERAESSVQFAIGSLRQIPQVKKKGLSSSHPTTTDDTTPPSNGLPYDTKSIKENLPIQLTRLVHLVNDSFDDIDSSKFNQGRRRRRRRL